jgi:hypothetical protein
LVDARPEIAEPRSHAAYLKFTSWCREAAIASLTHSFYILGPNSDGVEERIIGAGDEREA